MAGFFERLKQEGERLVGFEPIHGEEIALVMREERKNPGLKLNGALVSYSRQHNFTLATILVGNEVVTGVCKRTVTDPDFEDHARRLAFRRAVSNYSVRSTSE